MWIKDLVWDETNLDHIAYHNVEQHEVEEALGGDAWFKKRGRDRYYAYSQTDSGRYLFIVLDREYDDCFYVVTARDMDDREKRFYRKVRKG